MNNLSELVRGGTLCLSKAGIGIGGTTTKASITAPNGAGVDFAIAGKIYHVGEADDLLVFTARTQAALYSCIYLVCITAANVITLVPGTDVLTANVAAGNSPLQWPEPTVNTCPIGAIRIDSGASAFVAATTALTGGTVTVTYYDLFAVPDAPIVA